MRSEHVEFFNHDPLADEYDSDVNDEDDPIRNGYGATLDWVVEQADIGSTDTVLDLGAGTGNTASRIVHAGAVVCVDISSRMMAIARRKLAHLPDVSYVVEDLLSFWQQPGPTFDAVISTYAIHHLTESEKGQLFHYMARGLAPGARAVFGDLMFESKQHESHMHQQYVVAGLSEVYEAIDEEWFWHIDIQSRQLQAAGFQINHVQRFSDLSWGISTTLIP